MREKFKEQATLEIIDDMKKNWKDLLSVEKFGITNTKKLIIKKISELALSEADKQDLSDQ